MGPNIRGLQDASVVKEPKTDELLIPERVDKEGAIRCQFLEERNRSRTLGF